MLAGTQSLATAVLIGLGTGILSGTFGVGGGIVMTPAIRLLLDTEPLIAVGTTLTVTLPSALSGGLRYARQGLVDFRLASWAAAAGVPASIAGSWATKLAPGPILMILLAIVVAGVGLDFVSGARERRMARARAALVSSMASSGASATGTSPSGVSASGMGPGAAARSHGDLTERARWLATGGLIGFTSGLLGIGGGVLAVPLFLSWLKLPIKRAMGTSLALVASLATPGSIVHAILGHVDALLAIALAIGVIPGAWLGAGLASRLSDSRLIRAFGFLLLVVALTFGYEEIREMMAGSRMAS